MLPVPVLPMSILLIHTFRPFSLSKINVHYTHWCINICKVVFKATVEPINNGKDHFVHYREVVLSLEVKMYCHWSESVFY